MPKLDCTSREYYERIFGKCHPGKLVGMPLEIAEEIVEDKNYHDLDPALKDWAWNRIMAEMNRLQ